MELKTCLLLAGSAALVVTGVGYYLRKSGTMGKIWPFGRRSGSSRHGILPGSGGFSSEPSGDIEGVNEEVRRRKEKELRQAQQAELAALRAELERRKESCWESERVFEEQDEKSKRYNRIFEGENGIYAVMQRFLGYCAYVLDGDGREGFNYQLDEFVTHGMLYTVRKNPEKPCPGEEEKNAFFRGLGVSETAETGDYERDRAALENACGRLRQVEKFKRQDLSHLRSASSGGQLALLTEKLERIDALNPVPSDADLAAAKKSVRAGAGEIRELLGEDGVRYFLYEDVSDPESRELWFDVLESADCCPAAVRRESGKIVRKGRITADRVRSAAEME